MTQQYNNQMTSHQFDPFQTEWPVVIYQLSLFGNNQRCSFQPDKSIASLSEIKLVQSRWQFDEPPESTASLRSVHQTRASSGPHLELIRPPDSRVRGVEQPHVEHRGAVQRKLRKQRCDTWVSRPHLRSHFIFYLSSSR